MLLLTDNAPSHSRALFSCCLNILSAVHGSGASLNFQVMLFKKYISFRLWTIQVVIPLIDLGKGN